MLALASRRNNLQSARTSRFLESDNICGFSLGLTLDKPIRGCMIDLCQTARFIFMNPNPRQTFFRDGLELGWFAWKSEDHPMWSRPWDLEEDSLPGMTIFMDRIWALDDRGDILFDTGMFSEELKLSSRRVSLHTCYRIAMRTGAILGYLLDETLPFYADITLPNHRFRLPLGKAMKEISLNPFVLAEKWKSLVPDFRLLNAAIPYRRSLEEALIWYNLGMRGSSSMERFLNFYRGMEVLANSWAEPFRMKLGNLVRAELGESFVQEQWAKSRPPKTAIMRAYLLRAGITQELVSRLLETRHKVVHGADISLEFKDSFLESEAKLQTLLSVQLKLALKRLNVRGVQNPLLHKHYFVLESRDRTEREVLDSDDIGDERWRKFQISRDYRTLSDGEAMNLLRDESIPESVRRDLHYHYRLAGRVLKWPDSSNDSS